MRLEVVRSWMVVGSLLLFFTGCSNPESKGPTQVDEGDREHIVESSEQTKPQVILFFGNSLTAGYGLDPSQAFPNLIQQRLDSLGLNFKVVNAGLSGETSASGTNRIEWVLREPATIMILELGGNDGLRGISTKVMKNNLQEIIDLALKKHPQIRIILAGMEAPPNMGDDYIQQFRSVFPQLAQSNNLPLIPFLLDGVGGEPLLNLPDGIHPNEEGHQIVAENVWSILAGELDLLTANAGDN